MSLRGSMNTGLFWRRDIVSNISPKEAERRSRAYFRRASPAQLAYLTRLGYRGDRDIAAVTATALIQQALAMSMDVPPRNA